MMIVSGFIMAALRWRGPYPFVIVGFITLVTIWIIAAVVGGRHLREMHAAADNATGPVSPELSRVIRKPKAWATLFGLNTAALGVLFVMTTKLDWITAISVVLGLALLGVFIGGRMARGAGAGPAV